MELLVVIAVIGMLGGVAVFGVGKIRERAQVVALDSSLRALTTAAQAQMLMIGAGSVWDLSPETIEVDNTEGLDFAMYDPRGDEPSAEWVVIQARPAGSDTPCRQITFPTHTTPRPCATDLTTQPVYFGSRALEMMSAARDGGSSQNDGVPIQLGEPRSKWTSWEWKHPDLEDPWDGSGTWSASFPLTNTSDYDLYFEFTVTRTDSDGTTSSIEDKYQVAAHSTAPYVFDRNYFKRYIEMDAPQTNGTVKVQIKVNAVAGTVNDEWVRFQFDGPMTSIELPPLHIDGKPIANVLDGGGKGDNDKPFDTTTSTTYTPSADDEANAQKEKDEKAEHDASATTTAPPTTTTPPTSTTARPPFGKGGDKNYS